MLDSNDCIAIVRQEFARATTPRPASEPVAFIQDGFICRAWGESDHPAVAFVPDWEGVRQFMVREWLGDDDATDYDGENTLDRLKRDFAEHETDQRDGVYEIEFEIGGVSIERVRGFTATPQPAAKPAQAKTVARDEPEPFAWATFDGEGSYDLRLYQDNESYRDEYLKRNGPQFRSWVVPLYLAASPTQPRPQPMTEQKEPNENWVPVKGYAGMYQRKENKK
jgi:hypothetical protein